MSVPATEAPRVEYVPIDDLKPAKRNPKKHDVPGIMSSIRAHGFAEVLVENAKTGRLVAGHGRLEALVALRADDPKKPPKWILIDGRGRWLAPVLRGVSFKDEAEAEGYLLADNRWVELGGWRREDLAPVLRQILEKGGAEALARVGYSQDDFAKLAAAGAPAPSPIAPGAAGDGVIKQIVFPFRDKDMPLVLARLGRAMQLLAVTNHSEALLKLLEEHERPGR